MPTVLDKVVYTAHAHTTGGRDGRSVSDDGLLDVKLNPPKAMGGGGTGTNPEQLFAAGYSACFMGAMKHVAGMKKLAVPADAAPRSVVAVPVNSRVDVVRLVSPRPAMTSSRPRRSPPSLKNSTTSPTARSSTSRP